MAYATRTQLASAGLPAQALASVSTTIQDEHLDEATAVIDSYLRSRYAVPLASPYPSEVVRCCVALAAYSLISWRGYDPARTNETVRQRHEDALLWLRDVSAGRAALSVSADATPAIREGRPRVQTGTLDEDGVATGEPIGW